MFEIMNPLATWDDMWQNMLALTEYPFNNGKNLMNTGLRKLIGRPHNLVNVTDKDGNIIEQRLEVVTTPFKKEDVAVQVSGNTLTVKCGSEEDELKEKGDEEGKPVERYLYKGISEQYYTFSLKLSDKIDKAAIKAKNQDGVLTITLPYKKWEPAGDIAKITVE
jgi:HSP20 family molecular chaperone IbpA